MPINWNADKEIVTGPSPYKYVQGGRYYAADGTEVDVDGNALEERNTDGRVRVRGGHEDHG
jgi:hypothetical protein